MLFDESVISGSIKQIGLCYEKRYPNVYRKHYCNLYDSKARQRTKSLHTSKQIAFSETILTLQGF